MKKSLYPWSEISREERFFTSILYRDLLNNSSSLWKELKQKLKIKGEVSVKDVGYEVCFFRDAAHENLLNPQPKFQKLTFDLVLFLSNNSMVIIEAKAHQSYDTKQLNNLAEARNLILNDDKCKVKVVYLVGLHSAKYSPNDTILEKLDACLTWDNIINYYKDNKEYYKRANKIYND